MTPAPGVRTALVASLATLAWGAGTPVHARGAGADVPFYESKVQPILAARCYSCHSVSRGKRMSGLALDTRAALLKGGAEGPAVVPGRPERSLLLKAVRWEDGLEMPPDQRLPPAEVAVLEAWVRRGARGPTDPEGAPVVARRVTEARLWRLTWTQYENTARALLQTQVAAAQELDREMVFLGFKNRAQALLLETRATEQLFATARALASEAGERLTALLPCQEPAQRECGAGFVNRFGRQAFRRPLTGDEQDRYVALYTAAAEAGGSARGGVEAVVQAMLVSPNLLFRTEARSSHDALTAHQAAETLSYTLWDEPPDPALAQAADSGALLKASVYRRHADRLLADPRSARVFSAFFAQWLGYSDVDQVTKHPKLFPKFTPTTARALLQSADRFVAEIVRANGSWRTLMTGSFAYVNDDVAPLFDVTTSPESKGDFQRVKLDPSKRAGLITHPAFLAALATETVPSTVGRGLHLVEALLCEKPPPAPDDVDTQIAPQIARAARTKRELLAQHASGAECRGCHVTFDPLGLALENYDAIGRHRTTENDVTIDASGTVLFLDPPRNRFSNAVELARLLAGSRKVQQCFVNHLFSYFHGRAPADGDAPALRHIGRRFVASGLDVREALRALVTEPGFLQRRSVAVQPQASQRATERAVAKGLTP